MLNTLVNEKSSLLQSIQSVILSGWMLTPMLDIIKRQYAFFYPGMSADLIKTFEKSLKKKRDSQLLLAGPLGSNYFRDTISKAPKKIWESLQASGFDKPIYLFQGKNDFETPYALSKSFVDDNDTLKATNKPHFNIEAKYYLSLIHI